MAKNSKAKGKAGELEACRALADHLGMEASRSVQYCGATGDAADLKCDANIHFEVKRTESFQLYKAIEQATSQCGDKVPVVLHRRNRGEWLAIVPLARLSELAHEIIEHYSNGNGT